MVSLPNYLKNYKAAAEKYLAKGLVHEIEFSGPTYQVLVKDAETQQEAWTFLQLDAHGKIRDSFCSCESEDARPGCVHVAASYLRIYLKNHTPLHFRFDHSLWNHLCQIYADNVGNNPKILKKIDEKTYQYKSPSGKVIFSVHAKTKKSLQHLQKILETRKTETEETSLKFSNLSEDELMLWRQGKPSPQLSYELSFWNDLAKWLLSMQDTGEEYKITFDYDSDKFPSFINIDFHDLSIGFYLSQANLPLIIPSLSSVKSPLKARNTMEDSIGKIQYDKNQKTLHIHHKKTGPASSKAKKGKSIEGVQIEGWSYVSGDGFYAKEEDSILQKEIVEESDIARLLTAHHQLVADHIEEIQIHDFTLGASYQIAFDDKWNLHVACYALKPGDLTAPFSQNFGNWIYLNDDGFYRFERMRFDTVEKIVPYDHVPEFISQERAWLNNQDGFQTHLTSMEAQLTYKLGADNCLTFQTNTVVLDASIKHKDFEQWVYIEGQGFYAKTNQALTFSVRPGITITPDHIPNLIRMHRDELHLVKGFFSEKCPVGKTGLDILLRDDNIIAIHPVYELLPEYKDKDVRYFHDFIYTAGEGFHELPLDIRLPEKFQHGMEIMPDDQESFINFELDGLRDFATTIDPRLVRPKTLSLIAHDIDISELASQGWYQLKLQYHAPQGNLHITDVWTAIKNKQRFLFSKAGLLDLEDPRFNWIRMLPKSRVDKKHHTLSLSTVELIRLNAFDEILPPKESHAGYEHTNKILKELKDFTTPVPPDLTGLRSHLRNYQEIGVHWLWFLYYHNLSGLLCDDMGLGKTHQTMALVAAIMNAKKKQLTELPEGQAPLPSPKFLVICPTSVIFHWQEKLQEFLPHARVMTYYGTKRDLTHFGEHHDILLTSYGIWRRDSEILNNISFEVAIYDEIQIAKNYASLLHSSLVKLKAKMKLGLTGTPIENRLRELKSLFDLVLPSYMPGDSDFNDFFVKPIEKNRDRARLTLLSRFIKPFVLRRKKEDVLLDLPEKTEEISHCALLPSQHKLYHDVLHHTRNKLLDELQDQDNPIPYIHIFTLLSSLKQVCDHPAVYLKKPEQYQQFESGKWELFLELLNEARESQQKVVVYSQYLAMLDIITYYLQENHIGYATIRGSTTNRAEQVRMFNKDQECEVFVGSLHAAGLGIDLTAGSVVIHYDRWWNAARENQATDRVHRIGQKRGVQVFKLVTKGTFEERIDELIAKKAELMEDVVGVDEYHLIKKFDRKELIELLQDVGDIE